MATSGSTDFTLTGDNIITAALRVLRVIDPGETAPAGDITTGRQALNLLIKHWAGVKNINLWLTQEVCLFLEKDAQTYGLGPTGDYCGVLTDCVKTTLTTGAAAAATALTVASNSGVSASDYVGVELDDGTLHWDVQDGAIVGTTGLKLTTGLASAASSGNYVFAFTTKITRPIDIIEARIRDVNEADRSVRIVTNRLDYFGKITDPTSSGETTDIWYEPLPTNGSLYTWPVADDVTKRLIMTIRRTVEDFDASANNFDGPVEVLNALKWNLAVDIAAEYGRDIPQIVAEKAVETYLDVERRYRERANLRFYP